MSERKREREREREREYLGDISCQKTLPYHSLRMLLVGFFNESMNSSESIRSRKLNSGLSSYGILQSTLDGRLILICCS